MLFFYGASARSRTMLYTLVTTVSICSQIIGQNVIRLLELYPLSCYQGCMQTISLLAFTCLGRQAQSGRGNIFASQIVRT